jgi:hypothetical protein
MLDQKLASNMRKVRFRRLANVNLMNSVQACMKYILILA